MIKRGRKPISKEAQAFFETITPHQRQDIYKLLVERAELLKSMVDYKMPGATILDDEVFEQMIENLRHSNREITFSLIKPFDKFVKQQSKEKENQKDLDK